MHVEGDIRNRSSGYQSATNTSSHSICSTIGEQIGPLTTVARLEDNAIESVNCSELDQNRVSIQGGTDAPPVRQVVVGQVAGCESSARRAVTLSVSIVVASCPRQRLSVDPSDGRVDGDLAVEPDCRLCLTNDDAEHSLAGIGRVIEPDSKVAAAEQVVVRPVVVDSIGSADIVSGISEGGHVEHVGVRSRAPLDHAVGGGGRGRQKLGDAVGGGGLQRAGHAGALGEGGERGVAGGVVGVAGGNGAHGGAGAVTREAVRVARADEAVRADKAQTGARHACLGTCAMGGVEDALSVDQRSGEEQKNEEG